ncbi:MAG: type I restriction endonuclease subunit R [Methylicorpusculum sp.]|jgi:type I restriction enzyme R subunit|uniref:type I restriction endonuclease subunit R n=1 Tax=Methylicorpusculum TaxID=2713642 RepID=UPI0013574850|nr:MULTISPECIES: type I restriction endonuclease subunit R [Methylicorpusculum]MBS3951912.1 type I restriction endonuclease subunit R [Methylomicrobium sp.]MCD2451999.1 type I restriction endonuclease subunit R [Methylicorpusculum oleiharenae]MDP2203537.1 type I restriction endonuclease subunit R [Methylicorpusculum sp.]
MSMVPETKEVFSSQIPALQVLMAMGYEYLSPAQALAYRGGQTSEVLLRTVLIAELRKRRFNWKGQEYPLSNNAIDDIVRQLASPGLGEGLLSANERLYDHLTLGLTVTEFIDGKKAQPTIAIIDWENPANNCFQVTDEFDVLNAGSTGTRRPDIVCFVNGIPLVCIEAKRPDPHNPHKDMLKEGISQHLRNQGVAEIPHLFAYSQLLLSVNGLDGRYGTTRTPAKFWALWREELLQDDTFDAIKNTALSECQAAQLFGHRPAWMRQYFDSQAAQGKLLVTGQDKLIVSLLNPDRLLEFMRFFILFDKKSGKIAARYQQYFGIKKLVDQVTHKDSRDARQGGVIWHTTGSGKSFTMVFMAKALILHEQLKPCRFFVVTDRIDLETQLSKVFANAGVLASPRDIEKAKATSGKDLAQRISQGNERILFSIINKFATASKQPECHNPSSDIIVLVDEGHRSHGGETHERMRQALPNAAYIAFTGTPLLKNDKTTNKFGPIIHAYTMQRAVEDGTVTPLLYEERVPELGTNAKAIDNWFERITEGLTDKQRADLKKKFAQKGQIYQSESRIELIAHDIADHFVKNVADGLKAQLATDSKLSAIRYKKYLDETGLVTSAIVMSPPDTREGHEEVDESHLPEVQQWWLEHVGNQSEEAYTKEVIRRFADEDDPQILIVVDKLLTGFDEPRNAVLYIDKPLKQHNLIQAIARVNRLHELKKFGLLIDYRGILKELDTTLEAYQNLAERTQDGYDIDDLVGLYRQVNTEYKKLPVLHDTLWAIFKDVKNRADLEQFRQVLIPHYQTDDAGDSYDAKQKVREDFYEALTAFSLCLEVALGSSSFYEDRSFNEEDIRTYKRDVRFFSQLRQIARQDAGETIDYSDYAARIKKLIDKHVVGEGIREPEGVFIVNELGKQKPEDWTDEKTRNETDIIRTRLKKTIEQDLQDDPYAQKVFSELLDQAIRDAEAMFEHPFKQYVLFKDLEEKLAERDVPDTPDPLASNSHAKAYFGVFKLVFGEDAFNALSEADRQSYVEQAFAIDELVDKAVAENSVNPQNIEAEIRKGLLPRLFKMIGMDKAKEVIEHIVQITRVGLSKER